MIRFLKDSFIKKYKVFDSKLFFGNSLINFLIKIYINIQKYDSATITKIPVNKIDKSVIVEMNNVKDFVNRQEF